MSRCLVVQHAPAEKPYFAATALSQAGVHVDVCEVWTGEPVPSSLESYAGLLLMGGPMSAASDEGFPTRVAELALVRDALSGGTPFLGICLGAQLLAAAAGAPVYPGDSGPEIGWAPVRILEEAAADPLFDSLPSRVPVLHWHGDTFDLPSGAVRLASSALYENQAFRLGQHAWGLQFHLEVDEEGVEAFVSALGHEAAAAGVNPSIITEGAAAGLAEMAPTRYLVLSRFAQLVAAAKVGN